jgi:hypothetical protein
MLHYLLIFWAVLYGIVTLSAAIANIYTAFKQSRESNPTSVRTTSQQIRAEVPAAPNLSVPTPAGRAVASRQRATPRQIASAPGFARAKRVPTGLGRYDSDLPVQVEPAPVAAAASVAAVDKTDHGIPAAIASQDALPFETPALPLEGPATIEESACGGILVIEPPYIDLSADEEPTYVHPVWIENFQPSRVVCVDEGGSASHR